MLMENVELKVYAKINLSLNVIGIKGGLHELDSVMTSVGIADVVSVTPRKDKEVRLVFSDGMNPLCTNACKAAKIMQERFGIPGADIYIRRNIPAGGGLGGSSADAAGVIRALDVLYGINAERGELIEVAAKIGSDVPYMLYGGLARLSGTGDDFKSFDGVSGSVILCGRGDVNTGECFRCFDRSGENGTVTDNEELLNTLKNDGFNAASVYFKNALYSSACSINPDIERIVRIMENSGLSAHMTGSGSYVFGVSGEGDITEAAEALRRDGYRDIFFADTINSGIEFL